MEKASGRVLADVWYELSEKERIKIVVQVARVESTLFSIALPAYGSIYFKSDLENKTETVDVTAGDVVYKDENQEARQMCIGPDVAQKWWYEKRSSLKIPRGPCK